MEESGLKPKLDSKFPSLRIRLPNPRNLPSSFAAYRLETILNQGTNETTKSLNRVPILKSRKPSRRTLSQWHRNCGDRGGSLNQKNPEVIMNTKTVLKVYDDLGVFLV